MSKGNHNATGKKAGHGPELIQYVRRILLGAFEIVEKSGGQKITEILAGEAQTNPLKFLEVVSKYCPREVAMEIAGRVLHQSEMSEAELERIATGRSPRAAVSQAGPDISTDIH